jgi:septal ring factor EnvC (AmiA/AmiB activator)
MEQFLLEASKTNSVPLIFSASLMVLVYYIIKEQRDKTATKRDSEKKDQDIRLALQEKDIENMKSQISILMTRWNTLNDLLSKINENLSAIRENISSLDSRIKRIEEDEDRNR